MYQDVAAEIHAVIAESSDASAFRSLLVRLMARPGRVLAQAGEARWPAFVLDVGRELGGDPAAGLVAAAAVEFTVAGIDVLDDIVDDDWDEADGPWRHAANGAAALAWPALRCANRLTKVLGPERGARIAELLAGGSLASYAGQVADLALEGDPEATRRKSGSLVAMACAIGAATAMDDHVVIDAFWRFGEHVGIVAQLLNDLAGVEPGSLSRGSDIRRRKKTLPIAYALQCAREEGLIGNFAAHRWHESSHPEEEEQIAMGIRALGGLHYTWVVADAHRREALAALEALVPIIGRGAAKNLRHLVPPVPLR